jgi:hypothetical protein
MVLKLYADPKCWQFRDLYPDDWAEFACGPGDFGDYLVPDSILGVSVNEACRIHDWYYRFAEGATEDDRAIADRIFLNNMLRIVVDASGWKLTVRLRCRVAYIYYRAVRRYGAPAFFDERNPESECREV